MSEIRLRAQTRTEFGKGAARRLRQRAQVPAVIYASEKAPVRHIALPARELQKAMKNANVLLELQLDDGVQLVLPRSVQRNAVRPVIEHVDLVTVRRGEKVVVEVPVVTDGKLVPDALVEHIHDRIAVEAEATHIPESFTVLLDDLQIGAAVHAKDVPLPPGTTLVADPELVVLHVLTAQMADEEEPVESEEPAADAEPAAEES